MIAKKIEQGINVQINKELYSAYLYLSMSAWLESRTWKGFAAWMRVQHKEELGHAERFFDHLVARAGTAKLDKIDAPPTEWKSVLELFEAGLEHERLVTKRIHDLAAAADEAKDYATASMLKWFIDEQVEEEASFEEVVAQLKKIGDSDRGLFMLDHQLGKRKSE